MFKRHLNREWGHHIARGWALLLLDRLRDYVGAQEYGVHVQPGEHFFGPDSAAAHTQWAYNNGHGARTNHHTHGRDA